MQWLKRKSNWGVAAFFSACAAFAYSGFAVETEDAVSVSVENVSVKVGEKATVVATVIPREGIKIADAYRNRLTTLSAADDSVEFENNSVRGSVQQDGRLIFKIRVVAKTPGTHPINGVMRVGLVNTLDGDYHLDIKSVPLVATVTGTE